MHTIQLSDDELLFVSFALYGQIAMTVMTDEERPAVLRAIQCTVDDYGVESAQSLADRFQALNPDLFDGTQDS